MIKKVFFLLLLPLLVYTQNNTFKLVDAAPGALVYTSDCGKGLYFTDIASGKSITLESDFGASYQAVFSANGAFLLYKNIDFSGDNSLQTPMLFDINQKKNIPLSEPLFQCGVPSISLNGKIAFMAGGELRILNPDLSIAKKIDIGNYANLSAISPNGEIAALNNNLNQFFLLDISNGYREYITSGNDYYYEPQWSEDGSFLSYKNAQSDIFIYDVKGKNSVYIAKGSSVKWSGNEIYFVESKYDSDANLISTSICKYNADRQSKSIIESNTDKFYNSVLLYNSAPLFTRLNSNKISAPGLAKISGSLSGMELTDNTSENMEYKPSAFYKSSQPQVDKVIVRFDSVYFNQVYDCRIDRAGIGDGCCGAASALMGLMFYKLLPEWGYQSLNKSYSPYANYLSEVYTYRDVTFNISYTRSGGGYYNTGLGIYGWIYRNSLEDTKGHMASLLVNHGLQSSVDWSPSVQKAITEVDGGYPLVLLNSLTTSGHYIVLTGYADRVGTLIFNDPYGDRNRSSYLRDNSKRIKYDYPGYSNGYANLNTSWCYIYMRNAADIKMSASSWEYDYQPDSKIKMRYTIKNNGTLNIESPFKVRVLLSEDKLIDNSDIVLYEKEFSSLSIVDSLKDSASFIPPTSSATKTFNLFLVTDSDGSLNEVTKSNNNSSFSLTVLGKPATLILYPFANATVTHSKPTIFISYTVDQKIDTGAARIKLNNSDVTHLFQKYSNKMQYYPTGDYSNGNYTVEVYLKNIAGYDTTITWSFKVDAPLVGVENPNQVTEYNLSQNYPNPFNPSTRISYSIPRSGNVKIILYDASGKEIKTLVDEIKNSGNYTINLDASNLASGTYLYRIVSGEFTQTKKMILVK